MGRRKKKRGILGMFSKPKRGRPSYSRFSEMTGKFDTHLNVSSETKKGIFTILLFVIGVLSLLGLFDLSGAFGRWIIGILALLLGGFSWLFPVLTLLFVYFLMRSGTYKVRVVNYFGALLLVVGLTVLAHLKYDVSEAIAMARAGYGGGYLGGLLAPPLLRIVGFWGGVVISIAVFLVGLLLTFETSLYGLMWPVRVFKVVGGHISRFVDVLMEKMREQSIKQGDEDTDYEEDVDDEEDDVEDEAEKGVDPSFSNSQVAASDNSEDEVKIGKVKKFGKKIELPLDLLTSRSSKPTSGDIKANQEIIKKTLANFGINVELSNVNVGPTVTQYTMRPADGVKLSRITNLGNDLSLALAAHPIRIEAPIPGKSLVGIEVPNQTAAKVTMRDLLTSKQFAERSSNLSIALGKDVSGESYFTDLTKMPHLLIAGATGSGKSVCINSVILSLLYQNSPDELKFILVDPKRVELPLYNGIPYLLTPVITDAKKTINALKWTIAEMDRRFDLLSQRGKRNIEIYNKSASDRLPYIVFIVDELADLMSTSSSDIEAGIVRLAQMARAVGIHLILATQRPSVEVITGLIKANVPSRIAFSVASLIDSRTILDASGAEKLVGRGDMLFLGPNVSKPKRVQGVYASEREVKDIVRYIKDQGEAEYLDEVVERKSGGHDQGGNFSDDDGDALIGEAKDVIREAGKASASLLQRRLKIGYARAARILDLLEEQGIIGPSDGAKAREVFLDRLGGVGAVEFAAKEHNLEGELSEEASPTVFKDGDEVDVPEKTDDKMIEGLDDFGDEEGVIDVSDDSDKDNSAEIEEDEVVEPKKKKKKLVKKDTDNDDGDDNDNKETEFGEDEWT
jgi:DNA segregation ATPase FtsK/SpoIIIE, S-DNA-T family